MVAQRAGGFEEHRADGVNRSAVCLEILWSPLMDAVRLPVLGRRRGWMLLTQAGLLAALAAYAFLNPRNHLPLIADLSVLIAFFPPVRTLY